MTCEKRTGGEKEKTPQADRIKSRIKSSNGQQLTTTETPKRMQRRKAPLEMDEIFIWFVSAVNGGV